MHKVKQYFEGAHLTNIRATLSDQLEGVVDLIRQSKRIAIAVGSRGITNIDLIVATLVDFLKNFDAEICIVPAMGSHGNATNSGQEDVLRQYGITPETMGVPIYSNMDVVQLGATRKGIPVLFDAIAAESDLVIPINRIKPHTDYRGEIESGLCKMMAIGLGNHEGCSTLHKQGFKAFPDLIPQVAQLILNEANVKFGVAVVENGYEQTHTIEVIRGDTLLRREKELLVLAKSLMARIHLDMPIDVLIIEEIGKEISGAGMDPNIVGRTTEGYIDGYHGPRAARIIVLRLTQKTKGNALGIGLADFTLESTAKNIDYETTFTNAIASGNPESGAVPVFLKSETEAIHAALKCVPGCDIDNPTIMKIKNTLNLEYIEVSDALLSNIQNNNNMELCQ
jgi:hypothetical protein